MSTNNNFNDNSSESKHDSSAKHQTDGVKNNVYALNKQKQEIHVSQAFSGANGYYCLGCKGEMQAVISRQQNRISYFRHAPKDVSRRAECTYSDETYRHRLAKAFLQELKKIKVPAVYKYPPVGVEGKANKLKESRFIEANYIGIEKTFYEDSDGKVSWTKGKSIDEKSFIIRPDITFFNIHNSPILFIELVATHKVSFEKRARIRALGVDTVQVYVPRESPEKIKNVFYKTSNTKWIYNNEEAIANYIPIPLYNTEAISESYRLQRRLLEESYKCRKAQLGNLVRSIRKCLESEPYRRIEKQYQQELQRAGELKNQAEEQWERLQREIREGVDRVYYDRRIKLEEGERKVRDRRENLERRYLNKKWEDSEEESTIERNLRAIRQNLRSNNEEHRRIKAEKNEIERDIEKLLSKNQP